MSSRHRAQDPVLRAESLQEWAARIAADFPVPDPEVADRLVALLLPKPADRRCNHAQQGA